MDGGSGWMGYFFFLFVLHAVALGGMKAEKKKHGILCRYDYYVFPTSHVVCLVRFHLFFFPYSGLYPPVCKDEMTGLETKSGRLHNKRMLPGVVLAMRLVFANYLTLSLFFLLCF